MAASLQISLIKSVVVTIARRSYEQEVPTEGGEISHADALTVK